MERRDFLLAGVVAGASALVTQKLRAIPQIEVVQDMPAEPRRLSSVRPEGALIYEANTAEGYPAILDKIAIWYWGGKYGDKYVGYNIFDGLSRWVVAPGQRLQLWVR